MIRRKFRARHSVTPRWLWLVVVASVSTALAQPASAQKPAARSPRAARAPRGPSHWRSMSKNRRFDPKKPLVFVSDHDDTLVPSWKLTKAPASHMAPEMKALIERAARRGDTHIIISSGSPLHKLEAFYEGTNADLLGNFGMQTRVDGRHAEDPVASRARSSVSRLAKRAEVLAVEQGLGPDIVRRKDTSLSFHQGTLTEAQWQAYSSKLVKLIEAEPKLEAHVKGESVEVVPKGAGSKRVSIERWLTLKYGKDWRNRVNLVYVGDSGGVGGGDEPAFRMAKEHGGIGILVRHGEAHDANTAADHYARDMNDVKSLIGWVASRRAHPEALRSTNKSRDKADDQTGEGER